MVLKKHETLINVMNCFVHISLVLAGCLLWLGLSITSGEEALSESGNQHFTTSESSYNVPSLPATKITFWGAEGNVLFSKSMCNFRHKQGKKKHTFLNQASIKK